LWVVRMVIETIRQAIPVGDVLLPTLRNVDGTAEL
jgi:hypothetical protein